MCMTPPSAQLRTRRNPAGPVSLLHADTGSAVGRRDNRQLDESSCKCLARFLMRELCTY